MTEEVMMVPTKEFDQLVQYYKGEITDNALLNKAGRLAAESHVILGDKSIPDSIAIKQIKPLARQRGRLTKRIRQIGPLSSNSAAVGEEEEEEEEGDLVKGPLETMFKQLIKNTSRGTKTPKIKEEATPSTPGVKKETKGTKPPIPPKPSSSKSGGWKKAALSGATKATLRKIGIDPKLIDKYDTDDEGGYSPKGKGKGKHPKAKKSEAEKLQEGWEGWDSPTRKTLGYDTT